MSKRKWVEEFEQGPEPVIPGQPSGAKGIVPVKLPSFIRYEDVIKTGKVTSLAAGATATILSYTVPVGYWFELRNLGIEADSVQGNQKVEFTIKIQDAALPDASAIGLDFWNISKESNVLRHVVQGGHTISITVKNNDTSVAYTISALIVGRRIPMPA